MSEPIMNRISETIQDFVGFYAAVMAESGVNQISRDYSIDGMGQYQLVITRREDPAPGSMEAKIQE